MQKVVLVLLLIIFTTPNLFAKRFRNAYVSFELPPKWECQSESTEWVCFNKYDKKKSKEAIIILTAKEAGPQDTVNNYLTKLKVPFKIMGKNKKPVSSKIITTKQRIINGVRWADSHHLNSEHQGFYTRYLATLKDSLAILVTFSAHKKFYSKYSSDFIGAIKSLKVIAPKNFLSRTDFKRGNNTGSTGIGTGGPIGPGISNDSSDSIRIKKSGSNSLITKALYLFLILGSIGLYLYVKKK